MYDDLNPLAVIVTFITMAVMVFFGAKAILPMVPNTQSSSSYVQSIKEDTVAIYPNTVTDNKNDYFVVTGSDETFHIVTSKENGTFTHIETEVTEDTQELATMKDASIQAKANQTNNDHANTDVLWKGLALFNLYNVLK